MFILFIYCLLFKKKIYDGEKWWPAAGRFRCPVIPANNPSSIWIKNYSASFSFVMRLLFRTLIREGISWNFKLRKSLIMEIFFFWIAIFKSFHLWWTVPAVICYHSKMDMGPFYTKVITKQVQKWSTMEIVAPFWKNRLFSAPTGEKVFLKFKFREKRVSNRFLSHCEGAVLLWFPKECVQESLKSKKMERKCVWITKFTQQQVSFVFSPWNSIFEKVIKRNESTILFFFYMKCV